MQLKRNPKAFVYHSRRLGSVRKVLTAVSLIQQHKMQMASNSNASFAISLKREKFARMRSVDFRMKNLYSSRLHRNNKTSIGKSSIPTEAEAAEGGEEEETEEESAERQEISLRWQCGINCTDF